MSKATAVLFGVEDDCMSSALTGLLPDQVKILIDLRSVKAACPTCEVVTARVKDRPVRRMKDFGPRGSRPSVVAETAPSAAR